MGIAARAAREIQRGAVTGSVLLYCGLLLNILAELPVFRAMQSACSGPFWQSIQLLYIFCCKQPSRGVVKGATGAGLIASTATGDCQLLLL